MAGKEENSDFKIMTEQQVEAIATLFREERRCRLNPSHFLQTMWWKCD